MTDQLYQLNYDLDGTSYAVRENLVDILERELLGPTPAPKRCCRSAHGRTTSLVTLRRLGSTGKARPTDEARLTNKRSMTSL